MSFQSFDEIREKAEAKRKQKARRKTYAPEKAALPLANQIESIVPIPADGIDRFVDIITDHPREICLTPEAKEARRLELWARCGGECEGCKFEIGYSTFELHHKFGRGAGKRCDCMQCIQALCKNALMADGSMRPGCHTKVHAVGILDGDYKRPLND